jgi:hypothetical protein
MPRSSAHTSIGGISTNAASKAIATLSVTTMPKSRRSGNDDEISTPKPPMIVSAEVKKARPVRRAAVSTAFRGSSPFCRSSM